MASGEQDKNTNTGYVLPINSTYGQRTATDSLTPQPQSTSLPEYEGLHHSKPEGIHTSKLNPRASPWYPEVNLGAGPNHFIPSVPVPVDTGYTQIQPPLPHYRQEHMGMGSRLSPSLASTSQAGASFHYSSIWVPPPPHHIPPYPPTPLPPDIPYAVPYLPIGPPLPIVYDSRTAESSVSGRVSPPDELTCQLVPLTGRATVTTREHSSHTLATSSAHAHTFSSLRPPPNIISQVANGPMPVIMGGERFSLAGGQTSGRPFLPTEQFGSVNNDATQHAPTIPMATMFHGPTVTPRQAAALVPNQSFHSSPPKSPQYYASTSQASAPLQHPYPVLQSSSKSLTRSVHPTNKKYRPVPLKGIKNARQNYSGSFPRPPKGQHIVNPDISTSSSKQASSFRNWPFSQKQPNEFLQALYLVLLERCIDGQPEPIYGSPTSIEIRQRIFTGLRCPPVSLEETGKSMYLSFIQNGTCLFCFDSPGAKEERIIAHVRFHMDHRAFTCTYESCSVCSLNERKSFFSFERLNDHLKRQEMVECPQCRTKYRLDNRSRHSCSNAYSGPLSN